MKLEFYQQISKSTQITNFLKIRALGQEFFHAEGQTDRQADRYDEACLLFWRYKPL
jgi:hypothetical protein